MKDDNITWIFAYEHEGEYYPERLVNIDKDLDNLEYADVKDNSYQLWQWPSGDIFAIVPDREVESGKEYSVPYDDSGTVWLPTLEKIASDKEKVDKALEKFNQSN